MASAPPSAASPIVRHLLLMILITLMGSAAGLMLYAFLWP